MRKSHKYYTGKKIKFVKKTVYVSWQNWTYSKEQHWKILKIFFYWTSKMIPINKFKCSTSLACFLKKPFVFDKNLHHNFISKKSIKISKKNLTTKTWQKFFIPNNLHHIIRGNSNIRKYKKFLYYARIEKNIQNGEIRWIVSLKRGA